MSIRRVVPDISSNQIEASRRFYTQFLGFNVAMDMGWVVTFASPDNPTAQLTVMQAQPESQTPSISIEVADVDSLYAKAAEQGVEIVYPLTTEPWGVRRFFAVDPNGVVINILSHVTQA